MSLPPQWRRFQFFDKDFVKEPGTSQPHDVLLKMDKTCSASGRGNLIFGDTDGFLNMVDRDFNVTSFQAYENTVTHLQQLKQRNILLSLGTDEEIYPILKIWNLDKIDKTGTPVCMRSIPLNKINAVTTFAALEDMSQIALGLFNGSVVLIYGDILYERNPKQRLLHRPSDLPVTGLGWREKSQNTTLFVVTLHQVFSYTMTEQRDIQEKLDDQGCEAGCCVMSDDDNMVLGKPEAVYFYESEGRGPCFALEGQKTILTWFRTYLVIVGSDPANPKFNSFNIYDLRNKFIAYTGSFQGIKQVVAEWGSIFIVTADGIVHQLIEKDMQTKLESLFKKNLYPVAINLALYQQYDYDSVIEIFRRYGDHLYQKGDYDGAISQYLRTIGKLEPSYVIRKFLDAQRIHNLTSYLQALHEKNLANADHTTLLLNCYTKLKDVNKLDEFIRTGSERKFDVETAIKVSRQAGYFEHALYLAKHNNRHEWYLKILLEDVKDYNQALDYISTLDFFEAEKILKKYGKVLVSNLPDQTTHLLMRLCSNFSTQTTSNGQPLRAVADDFIHTFVGQSSHLIQFLEFIVRENLSTPIIINTLLEMYLKTDDELYSLTTEQREAALRERQQKAMTLLTGDKPYDKDHALVLVQTHNFRAGILYLYEQLGLFQEIVQYHMENNDHDGVIRACKKYGETDSNLWVQALSYFASKDENCEAKIIEVLNSIDRDNLLPPLLILQILAQNQTVTLGVVKDYITKRLQSESQFIAEDQRTIRTCTEETEKMKADIEELRTGAKIFQLSKCSACTSPLDLPAIHFMCIHSFHQRCLGENEKECPICAPNNRKIIEIQASLAEGATKHEDFFQKLEKDGKEGFYWVSEYFGRGLFNPKMQPDGPAAPTKGGSVPPRKQ